MFRIYLAGPIEGMTPEEASDWRLDVTKELHQRSEGKVIGVNPYRSTSSEPKHVAQKNLLDTQLCDLLYVYLPKHLTERQIMTVGTFMEIGWFTMLHKPIVLVTDNDFLKTHPLMNHFCGYVYDNHDDAMDIVLTLGAPHG